jgi:hypothetical protein
VPPATEGTALPPRTAVRSTPPAGAAPLNAEQMHETHGLTVPESHPDSPTLRIAGFSDINFEATDRPGSRSGFNEGQFILHFSSALSPRVSFFGELSLTARADAGTGTPPAPGFNVEVERSLIRFDQSDYFKVSFGRYHTPINYWNNTFHHGSWLQTTISRPEMTQFGGSFIPVHFVGGLTEGSVPLRGLNLNYNFGLGNGRGSVINRAGDFGDANNNRAWLVNAFVKPDRIYGLQAGGSVYHDKVTPLGMSPVDEHISTAHLAWTRETPEILAEFANVAHRPAGSDRTLNNQAFYIQTAWRYRRVKPYYRYEHIHIVRGDLLFRTVPGLSGSTAGVRFDITSFAALKWEYRRIGRPEQRPYNGIFAQTAFTF